jgi:hypothetical protein
MKGVAGGVLKSGFESFEKILLMPAAWQKPPPQSR